MMDERWSGLASLMQSALAHPLVAQANETTSQEFRWLSPVASWVFILIILPLVFFFSWSIYRRERMRAHAGLRWTLVGIRTLVLLTVILILGEPVLRTMTFLSRDSVILLLVDDSLSMDIADKYSNRELVGRLAEFLRSSDDVVENTSRYDLVRRLLADEDINLLEKLRNKGEVAVFTFAGGLQRLEHFSRLRPGDLSREPDVEVLPSYDSVRVDGRVQQTRIADALLDAVASVRASGFGASEETIAAAILITDGQETGGKGVTLDVARRLGQRNIPTFTVGVGNPDEPKDIRALSLDVNEVVLANDEIPFDTAIVADGYAGESVEVELRFDGVVVDRETVILEGNGRRQTVRLKYNSPEPGEFIAQVEVEKRGGELFHENNAISKPIRVLDEKIRVLYLEGLPRWEYRYLQHALVRDPTMQAQVLLYSADRRFIQESSPGVPPLTGFPATEAELFAYHVIIIGDVDTEGTLGSRYLSPEQMALIKRFVYEAGGGVLFLAGELANPHKYRDTDLYSLLPVEIPESDRFDWAGDGPVSDPFNVRLTPAGREHSVMRLHNDIEENIELWENPRGRPGENLPGFYWFTEVGAAKTGSVTLARHPDKSRSALDEQGPVIFAYMNYGKGRTFFSAVDNTWRWRRGVENRYFYRYWGQVVRFSATGRLLGQTPRYGLATDKTSYTLGETVNIEAKVFDFNMRPVSDPTIVVYHMTDTSDVVASGPAQLELSLDPVRGQGTYHGTMVANRLGEHELWLGTEREKLAFRTFGVTVPAVELRDPKRNDPLLADLARATGGEAYELYEIEKAVDKLEGRSQSQRGNFKDNPLWDDSWVLLAFTVLIAAEWILRRLTRLL